MILFLGTRPGKTESTVLSSIACPYCQNLGTLTVYTTSNHFHLFYIKLFKIGSHALARCSHCKKAYEGDEFTASMKIAFEKEKGR
ncbi:MAG: zinc-ribbon domain-containing protein [Flavobacteriaceae bacterium]